MIFRNHRAGATLFPPHVLRLDRSTAPAAGFQRTAKYHTVHRLSQMEAPRVVFRTLQVPFGKSIINNSPRMRCNIHTGDPTAVMKPSPLSDQSYHEMADLYFEALLEEVDELREKGSNIIAEYSAGVLKISVPDVGSYIIEKQPSNKQIWLNSPISGQKYNDWVGLGQGGEDEIEEHEIREDEIYVEEWFGEWLYLKDGSNMSTLLNTELGMEMEMLFA